MGPRTQPLSLALLGLVAGAAVARAETIAIRGATILPQEGRVIEGADLVVIDDKVSALGERGKVEIPKGAREVDAKGLFVVPGLIDTHVHDQVDSFGELFVAHGVTTVRDQGNQLERVRMLREEMLSGRRLGPELLCVGPQLDGDPPCYPWMARALTDPDLVESTLAELKEAGVAAFKVYDRLSPEVFVAVVAEARKLGLPVIGHIPERVGLRGAIEAGQDTLAHLSLFAQAVSKKAIDDSFENDVVGWAHADEAKEKALLDLLVAHKTKLEPTRNAVRLSSLRRRGVRPDGEEYRLLPALLRDALWSSGARPQPRADRATDERHEAGLARALVFVEKAWKAGVPILVGSDCPYASAVPGAALHDEIEVLAGKLGPEVALKLATLGNADALGRPSLGRIVPGARADLLIVKADPRKDAKALRAISAVVLRGRLLDRAALDAILDGQRARAKLIDSRPLSGFEALAGDLVAGKKAEREVRLEGARGSKKTWMRFGTFAGANGERRFELRTLVATNFPTWTDESLVVDAKGEWVSFQVRTLCAIGESTETELVREKGVARVRFKRGERACGEAVLPQGALLESPGQLLLIHELSRASAAREAVVVPIDGDKLVLGEARDVTVARDGEKGTLSGRNGAPDELEVTFDKGGVPRSIRRTSPYSLAVDLSK